jgi:hypothetical protein
MYSSENPAAVRRRYEPLQYGLKAIRYRVRHFGHSTQWRRKEVINRLEICETLLPREVAMNTELPPSFHLAPLGARFSKSRGRGALVRKNRSNDRTRLDICGRCSLCARRFRTWLPMGLLRADCGVSLEEKPARHRIA